MLRRDQDFHGQNLWTLFKASGLFPESRGSHENRGVLDQMSPCGQSLRWTRARTEAKGSNWKPKSRQRTPAQQKGSGQAGTAGATIKCESSRTPRVTPGEPHHCVLAGGYCNQYNYEHNRRGEGRVRERKRGRETVQGERGRQREERQREGESSGERGERGKREKEGEFRGERTERPRQRQIRPDMTCLKLVVLSHCSTGGCQSKGVRCLEISGLN